MVYLRCRHRNMERHVLRTTFLAFAALLIPIGANLADAEPKYGPGASATEIKIGQTMPYSGPASTYSTIAKAEAAYFAMVNDQGGINGRKIRFISLDDAYSPSKTVEQVRKLVEGEEVLATFQTFGTATNSAILKYMNANKIPMLFVASGASRFADPKTYPWTIGYNASYQAEGRVYAKYILKEFPTAKIGILYQNDDLGRDYVKGLKKGLGPAASAMIVVESPYEVSEPSIESQLVNLKSSGANLLYDVTTPKFAAQAIRKVAELNWTPVHILGVDSISVAEVLRPAGLENSKGLIGMIFRKDPSDPTWQNDTGIQKYMSFMDKYYPGGVKDSAFNAYAYGAAELLVHVLKQCGDDLTRENLMKQASNIHDFVGTLSLPGTTVSTSADDYRITRQFQMVRFDGERWVPFGSLLSDEPES